MLLARSSNRRIVGFLASLGSIFAPFLAGIIGLIAFTNWITASIFAGSLVLTSLGFLRFHDRHHRAEAFDDKLTDQRMKRAVEEIIRQWRGDKQE